MTEPITLGQWLRDQRSKRSMTATEVARKTGITASKLSLLENDRCGMSNNEAIRLSVFYQVDTLFLESLDGADRCHDYAEYYRRYHREKRKPKPARTANRRPSSLKTISDLREMQPEKLATAIDEILSGKMMCMG